MSPTAFGRTDHETEPLRCSERAASAPFDEGFSRAADSSDLRLIEEVKRALCATGHASLRNLDVELCRGVVALSGRVPTYYQKQLAQETALRVEGIRGIVNWLEVVCRQR